MTYTKTTFYFALDGKNPSNVCTVFTQMFGGYTLSTKKGGWVNANGDIAEEVSYTLESITSEPLEPTQISTFATHVKQVYNQSEVWVTQENIQNTIY
jgi:putative IMPACT (imprinted ancient) family translation regulator